MARQHCVSINAEESTLRGDSLTIQAELIRTSDGRAPRLARHPPVDHRDVWVDEDGCGVRLLQGCGEAEGPGP